MKNNKEKIGKKYTQRSSGDNNIYQIEDVIVKEDGQEYFKIGPSLKNNGEEIECLCSNIDQEFLEQPNL